jgi:DNA-directed RNA polymerase subunit RPC12/RpoP
VDYYQNVEFPAEAMKRKKKLDNFAVSVHNKAASSDNPMSQFKFNCSHCGQHLECDEQFSGRQITCPACHALTLVPQVSGKAAPSPQKSGMTFVPDSWRKPPPPAAEQRET